MDQIEEAIFAVLKDNEIHSIKEIRKYMLEKNPELLQNKNYLNVILNRLVKNEKMVVSEKRGEYRMLQNNMGQGENGGTDDLRQKVLMGWRNYYNDVSCRYKLSYDMTDEQFREGKWLHDLNKKMEELIKTY